MMQLYDYQREGAEFLTSRKRAYLADPMGLGKTVQTCHATTLLHPKRVLWVGPASTLAQVRREWAIWGHAPAQFTAVSYETLTRQLGHYRYQSWDLVVLDEAHYVKSRSAQRTIAALTVARSANRAWLLSGTPMLNHPGELWPPLRALWPEIPASCGVRSYGEWLNAFCRWSQGEYGPKIWGSKNMDLLKPYLQRIMLRRKAEDVGLQLPPLRIDVQLLARDARMEEALLQAGWTPDALSHLDHMMEREATEDGSLSRLRRLLGMYKAARVGEIVKEELRTKQYRKIVVLAYHHDVISMLEQILEPFGVVTLTGLVLPKKRQRLIDEFTTGKARVFLGQQSAAGVGLNLQAAAEMVLVEPSWSPEDNAQAIKRVHRIGSTAPVRARIFAVEDSLDQGVMDVCARKTRMCLELGL